MISVGRVGRDTRLDMAYFSAALLIGACVLHAKNRTEEHTKERTSYSKVLAFVLPILLGAGIGYSLKKYRTGGIEGTRGAYGGAAVSVGVVTISEIVSNTNQQPMRASAQKLYDVYTWFRRFL